MNAETEDMSQIATFFQLIMEDNYLDKELVKAELRRIGVPNAIDFVSPILAGDKRKHARLAAAFTLGSTGDQAAISPLILALKKDEDGEVRSQAAFELGRIGHAEAITPLIEALSQDKESMVRQSAASALGELAAVQAIPALSDALFHDAGFRVGENAAEALRKIGGLEVIPQLDRALDEVLNSGVRYEVIRSLKDLDHPSTIPLLGKALLNDKSDINRSLAAEALRNIAHRDASPFLRKALDDERSYVRAETVSALAAIDKEDAIPIIAKALEDDSDDVRLAAATGYGNIRHSNGVPILLRVLNTEQNEEIRLAMINSLGYIADPTAIPALRNTLKEDKSEIVRIRIVQAMMMINHVDTIEPLVNSLLKDQTPGVREEISVALQFSNVISWQEKADRIIQALRGSELQRADVEAVRVLSAMMPPDEILLVNRHALTDYLIGFAKAQDNRMTAILAKLIIESASESVLLAGERVNDYEKINKVSKDELKKLRIEIGGETALDPIMEILQDDLETHFRKPITDLNNLTQSNWQKTILYAQYGFIARITMSVVVFLVGMVLLSISSWRIMFGQLDQTQLFGAGISFVSGLGSMLLIIYRGPLREIRDSVNDLGIASAAFIAYVHRVLQISHTFSYYYLNQLITFETMKKSSGLIREAMKDTTIRLQTRRADEERHKSS